jgi:hypothetical protein
MKEKTKEWVVGYRYGNTFPPETEIGQSCILFAKAPKIIKILYVSTPMRGVLLNYHPSQTLFVLKFRVAGFFMVQNRTLVDTFLTWKQSHRLAVSFSPVHRNFVSKVKVI